jgi:hypothetical protein
VIASCLPLGCIIAGVAHAQTATTVLPDGITLMFRAPVGCPSQADAENALATELKALALPDLPSITIDAEVSAPSEGGYLLQLKFSGDREGQRTLRATGCEAMATTAAVLTGMMLGEPTAAPPVPTEEPEAQGARSSDGAQPAVESSRARVGLGFSALADIGSLPRAVVGPAFSISFLLPTTELRAVLEVAHFSGTKDTLESGPAGVALSAIELGLRACLGATFGACAGFVLGSVSGTSREVAKPANEQALSAMPEFGIAWRPAIDRAARLRIELRGGLPLSRPRWQVSDYAFAHRASAVVGRAAIGFDFEL